MAKNTNQVAKTLGEQMADLLRRKPKKFDVVFCVGLEKIKVEAVKFILEAASPVFEREFEENWENGIVTDGNGIPLPSVDPTAFQLFVNLLILDAWSVDSLKSLKLSLNNLMNLLGLCRRYEITKAIENLEEAADDFIQFFNIYKDTTEFLETSRENLETIFSCEQIRLEEKEIFQYACRWASNQCTIKGLEPTGENYREVLGGCLFEIRFPTMSNEEFTQVGRFKKNVLTGDEKLDIYEYIGLNIEEKASYDTTQLQFKTNRRVPVNRSPLPGCSVLSLPSQYKLTSSPAFVCNGGHEFCRHFQVNQKMSLHGIGFLGPIDGDTHFDISVAIYRYAAGSHITSFSGTLMKNIFAQKGKIFYFLLDEPNIIESSTYDSTWHNCYCINFSLKGTSNVPQYKVDNPKDESFQASGVQFHLKDAWNSGNPLAELLFKKI